MKILPVLAALGWSCSTFAASATFPPSQQEYWAQFDRRDWPAAIAAAEQLVASARAATPVDPQRLADALTLLGNAHLGSKNSAGAQAAYREALAILEPHVVTASEKLLDPLRGLGYALAAGGQHGQAIPVLDRALTVSRRNFGLFNPGQQGLLRQLAGSLTAVDAAPEAEKHILYLLLIAERAYGADDPRMVPVFCSVGDWYSRTGNITRAREKYRTALELAERSAGKTSLAVIEPLRSIAESYRRELFLLSAGVLRQQQRASTAGYANANMRDEREITPQTLSSDGEKALLRALQILDATPDRPTALLLDTLVDAGDWYETRNQAGQAMQFYRRAMALVTPGANSPFAFPVQVYFPTPPLATRNRSRPDSEVNERFVQVGFTVTNDGTVKDAHVIEQDGTPRQVSETLAAIQAARYRPRFVSGEPVETTAMSFRQTFREPKENDGESDTDEAS